MEQSSARHKVGNGIYTSTEYPADRQILLHNEQSYNNTFPRFIAFYCEIAAVTGGETPLADTRRVLLRLEADLVARLASDGYEYRRNYGGPMQMSWKHAFQLSDTDALEAYCRANQIAFRWKGDRGGPKLETAQLRQVIARHPVTSEPVWFNHATFFTNRVWMWICERCCSRYAARTACRTPRPIRVASLSGPK